jgi:microcystin-dependent protein
MEGTIGFITPFAGNFAPKNWGYCNGNIIAIASNTALFSILGTTYGGNGTTTFALPDLRSRVAIGAGQSTTGSNYALGQVGGTESVTLNVNQMPAHVHMVQVQAQIQANADAASLDSPEGNVPAPGDIYAFATDGTTLAAGTLVGTGTMTPTGSNQPISLIQPVIGIAMCICMYGIFPSRN